VFEGSIQIGTLTTVAVFAGKVMDRLSYLVELVTIFIRTSVKVERTETLVGSQLVNHKVTTTAPFVDEFKELTITDLIVRKEGGQEALNGVNLTFKAGQKVAIVGYSGSGKSTLINTLLQVEDDYHGKIHINTRSLSSINASDLGKMISIVPQNVQLFRDTIEENIVLGNTIDPNTLKNILRLSLVEDIVGRKPQGIKTKINESNSNISGGEKQRIGIARSLIMNRPVVILDEATASLDPVTEKTLIKNIVTSYPETTLLFITHKYSMLELFDVIYVMSEGSVIESGTFGELLSKGGLFKDLYNAQQV
jgi:ABC-type bacteriocin/lantibiotic exporter with double-glycine peptidase domain